jgi:hypothetical protein
MSVCIYSAFVLLCVWVAALRRADRPVQRVLLSVYRINKLKKQPRSNKVTVEP